MYARVLKLLNHWGLMIIIRLNWYVIPQNKLKETKESVPDFRRPIFELLRVIARRLNRVNSWKISGKVFLRSYSIPRRKQPTTISTSVAHWHCGKSTTQKTLL